MRVTLSVRELTELVTTALENNGFSPKNARVIAQTVVAGERDGAMSHGLFRVAGYISDVNSGWVDGKAEPSVHDVAPGAIVVDANNGYCQPGYQASRDLLIEKARTNGIATLVIRNSHHLAALWPEVEALAEAGLIGLAFRNARPYVLPWGGKRKIFGTNPMAFACPSRSGAPIVWDQAASFMARGEIQLAAQHGERVPEGAGVDREGKLTTDPKAILEGGAQLPFGAHKGSMIALMVEVLAAAATGSALSVEDRAGQVAGAVSGRGGELIIAIDPAVTAGDGFVDTLERLLESLRGNGNARIPGERRRAARARSLAHGVEVEESMLARLRELAGDGG